jgi:hypothetical protein
MMARSPRCQFLDRHGAACTNATETNTGMFPRCVLHRRASFQMACLNWRRYRYRRGAARGCVCQAEELDQAERILEHAVQPSAIIDYFDHLDLELAAKR